MQDMVNKIKMLMDKLPEETRMTVIKLCSGEKPDFSPRVNKIISIRDKLDQKEQMMFKSYLSTNG